MGDKYARGIATDIIPKRNVPIREREEIMSMQDRADEEAERIEKEFEDGEITEEQYRRYMRELGEELAEYERSGH